MTTISRRSLLAVGAGGVAAAGVAATVPAHAAVTTRSVTQRVAVRWTYDAATRVTRVTRFTTRTVRARFIANGWVQLRNRAGVWVRVPYEWSPATKALVYSRYRHLQLLAALKPKPTPSPSPTPSPTASSTPTPTPTPTVTYASVTPYIGVDPARHVLRRAGFGVTAADLADVRNRGVASWIERQLTPAAIDDSECQHVLDRLPDQSEPIWKVRDLLDTDRRSGWEQQMSVLAGFTARALWSKRQLQVVLEDLWGNHFNVTDRADLSLVCQYMWHLGTDIHAEEHAGQVHFHKEKGANLEGHLLIHVSFNYKLFDAW